MDILGEIFNTFLKYCRKTIKVEFTTYYIKEKVFEFQLVFME